MLLLLLFFYFCIYFPLIDFNDKIIKGCFVVNYFFIMACELYHSIVGIFTFNVIAYHYVIAPMETSVSLLFFYTSSVLIPLISAAEVSLK